MTRMDLVQRDKQAYAKPLEVSHEKNEHPHCGGKQNYQLNAG